MGKRAQWVGTAVYREKRLRPLRDTRAHAREAGTTYGNNQVVERAARRLRGASETAPNFAFFISGGREKPGRPRQAYRSREIGALGGSTDVLLVCTQGCAELLEDLVARIGAFAVSGELETRLHHALEDAELQVTFVKVGRRRGST